MSEANGDSIHCLVGHLRELQAQWRETAKTIRPIDADGAVAHLECAAELEEILNGNMSPIAKWSDDMPNDQHTTSKSGDAVGSTGGGS